jgi:3-hydroxybutyryl-CoA dehydratase
VLDWSALARGAAFPAVAFALDDASIDAYLRVTGEAHPAYDRNGAGLAPPLYTTLVRLVKGSLGGRWPSGTLQLDQRIAMRRAVRRGDLLTLDAQVASTELRGTRRFLSLVTTVRNAGGDVVLEQSSSQMWAGAVQPRDRDSSPAAEARAAEPAARGADPGAAPGTSAGRIGPITTRYDLDTVRAFGAIAGALDPVHVDPAFALGTRWGRNIVQGRLAMTLAARLALQRFGQSWLERGWLDVRFVRPVMVDEPVAAWGIDRADGSLEVWCENARGERTIDGTAGLARGSSQSEGAGNTGART